MMAAMSTLVAQIFPSQDARTVCAQSYLICPTPCLGAVDFKFISLPLSYLEPGLFSSLGKLIDVDDSLECVPTCQVRLLCYTTRHRPILPLIPHQSHVKRFLPFILFI